MNITPTGAQRSFQGGEPRISNSPGPENRSLLGRIASAFSAAINWLVSLFSKKTPFSETYPLPLAKENLVEKAYALYKNKDQLEAQLRRDWGRGHPVYLEKEKLNTQDTDAALKKFEVYLQNNNIPDVEQCYEIVSCLLPDFAMSFQGPLAEALRPKYVPIADNTKPLARTTVSAKGGIATIEFSCFYQIVDKESCKPLCKMELTGIIDDHTTGLGRCVLKVSDPSSLPQDLKGILNQHRFQFTPPDTQAGLLLPGIFASAYKPPVLDNINNTADISDEDPSVEEEPPLYSENLPAFFLTAEKNPPLFTINIGLPVEVRTMELPNPKKINIIEDIFKGFKSKEELEDQIKADWNRGTIYLGNTKLQEQTPSVKEGMELYKTFLREKKISEEEIEKISACLQQGIYADSYQSLCSFINNGTESLNYLPRQDRTRPDPTRSASTKLSVNEGIVSIKTTSYFYICNAKNPSEILSEVKLTGIIPDHRTGIAHTYVTLLKDTV